MSDEPTFVADVIKAVAASSVLGAAAWGAAGGATSGLLIRVGRLALLRHMAVGALVAGGAGRPVVIGGRFSASGASAVQNFKGAIRAAFIGRTAWVAPSKELIRRSFIGEIASLYGSDFTLT